MKKAVVVFFITVVVLFGACAQREEVQSADITQKIIGTWADIKGGTWVFNAYGVVTIHSGEYEYAVVDTKLAYYNGNNSSTLYIYNISISSDGKTLILSPDGEYAGVWLTKR
jgi:outer membrane lipoprotein-sorting protein